MLLAWNFKLNDVDKLPSTTSSSSSSRSNKMQHFATSFNLEFQAITLHLSNLVTNIRSFFSLKIDCVPLHNDPTSICNNFINCIYVHNFCLLIIHIFPSISLLSYSFLLCTYYIYQHLFFNSVQLNWRNDWFDDAISYYLVTPETEYKLHINFSLFFFHILRFQLCWDMLHGF